MSNDLRDPQAPRSLPFHTSGQSTERDAAVLASPNAGKKRLIVLQAIAEAGVNGLTDMELADLTGLHRAAARRNDLLNDGWVVNSGTRRPTTNHATAVVWVLSDVGRLQYDKEFRRA